MNSKARTKNRASSRLAPIQKSRPENIWSIGENGRWGRRLRERQAGLLQICDGPWRQERCNSVTRHGAGWRGKRCLCAVLWRPATEPVRRAECDSISLFGFYLDTAMPAPSQPVIRRHPDDLIIGLVSISDRATSGVYQDQGVPALREWLGT